MIGTGISIIFWCFFQALFLKCRTNVSMNVQSHRTYIDWIQMRSFQWEGRVDMIPNQKANSNWHQLAREKFIFFRGLSLCILTTFKCRTHLYMANTKWNQWQFCRSLLSYEFAWYFFSLFFLLFFWSYL